MRIYVYQKWADRPKFASNQEPSIGYRYVAYEFTESKHLCMTRVLAETNQALLDNAPLPDYLIDTYAGPAF